MDTQTAVVGWEAVSDMHGNCCGHSDSGGGVGGCEAICTVTAVDRQTAVVGWEAVSDMHTVTAVDTQTAVVGWEAVSDMHGNCCGQADSGGGVGGCERYAR